MILSILIFISIRRKDNPPPPSHPCLLKGTLADPQVTFSRNIFEYKFRLLVVKSLTFLLANALTSSRCFL